MSLGKGESQSLPCYENIWILSLKYRTTLQSIGLVHCGTFASFSWSLRRIIFLKIRKIQLIYFSVSSNNIYIYFFFNINLWKLLLSGGKLGTNRKVIYSLWVGRVSESQCTQRQAERTEADCTIVLPWRW